MSAVNSAYCKLSYLSFFIPYKEGVQYFSILHTLILHTLELFHVSLGDGTTWVREDPTRVRTC